MSADDQSARIRQLEQERDAAKEQAAWSTAWIGKIAAALTGGGPLETYDPAQVEGSARRLVEKCDAAVAACAAAVDVVRQIRAIFDHRTGYEARSVAIMRVLDSTPVGAIGVDANAPGARLLDMLEKADGGLLLPGWFCRACGGTFNGEMKGPRVECRSCCAPREEKT